jgi:ABC-type sugar transport system ATPase subunit
MADVQLQSISKQFGGRTVLDDINLHIASGQYVVLLGPSGCGKSTLLKMIAGLEPASSGSVHLAKACVDNVPARKRDVSLIFQHDGLYPHLSIRQSIAMGLGDLPKAERNQRIDEASSLTDLDDFLERRPDSLSGGERQRAAIAKAIARRASVRLFDEPLAALDSHVRHNIQETLISWHRQHAGTTIHVTHDGHEAMRVADQIAVLAKKDPSAPGETSRDNQGATIVQVGSPSEIYRVPSSQTVALSLGTPPMSFLRGRIEDGQIISSNNSVGCNFASDQCLPKTADLSIGLRPDACRVVAFHDDQVSSAQLACPAGALFLAGELTRQYGHHYGVVESGNERFTIELPGADVIKRWVQIEVDPAELHLFDSRTGKSLRPTTSNPSR